LACLDLEVARLRPFIKYFRERAAGQFDAFSTLSQISKNGMRQLAHTLQK